MAGTSAVRPTRRRLILIAGSWSLLPIAWLVGVQFVDQTINWVVAVVAINLPLALLWNEPTARALGCTAMLISGMSALLFFFHFVIFFENTTTTVLAEGHADSGRRMRLYETRGPAFSEAQYARAEVDIAGILLITTRVDFEWAMDRGSYVAAWGDEQVLLRER